MTPGELKTARMRLGLTQAQLANALQLGRDGKRAVRRWEKGDRPISGPVAVAIGLMLQQRGLAPPEAGEPNNGTEPL